MQTIYIYSELGDQYWHYPKLTKAQKIGKRFICCALVSDTPNDAKITKTQVSPNMPPLIGEIGWSKDLGKKVKIETIIN
jgi:hypothetical protein